MNPIKSSECNGCFTKEDNTMQSELTEPSGGRQMFEEINHYRRRFLSTEAMTKSRIIRLSLVGMVVASLVGVGAFRAQSSFASNRRPSARARSVDVGNVAKPTIVLIHGAFADGTSWQHV